MTNNTAPLSGYCRHLAPCMNVITGRACALDRQHVNAYNPEGLPLVRNVTTGQEWLALSPYNGAPSGMRGAAAAAWLAAN